jgi:CMP-N-acetylneuraminic acid synthetase
MKSHSERVPGKNLRPLCGRPLFHWIMDAINTSGIFQEIIINTDSEGIAGSARDHFDVTIHMRPDYLLDIQSDESNQIMAYDLENTDGEYFFQSHSTNPLLKGETIKAAVETFFEKIDQYDSLFSVTPLQTRLYGEHFNVLNHDPKNLIKTQELPFVYEENSCIYVFSRNSFQENKNRIGSAPRLYPIDRFEAVDIDEEYDFLMAETLMQNRIKKN